MQTEMDQINTEEQKKQWQKPVVMELDVAMTKGGTIDYFSEDSYSVDGTLHGNIS